MVCNYYCRKLFQREVKKIKQDKFKDKINFARTYRKLSSDKISELLTFFICIIPFFLGILFFYPEITLMISKVAAAVLKPYYDYPVIIVNKAEYIKAIGPIYFISLPGSIPSMEFSIINLLGSIIGLLILPHINRMKPLVIFSIVTLLTHLTSSVFFTFNPQYFPYDLVDYSNLYMKQQIGIYLFTIIVIGMAISLLPGKKLTKFFTISLVFGYSLIFGTVRYIFFIYILSKISLIYMASLFFTFGPFVDFLYVVCIYSLFLNKTSQKVTADMEVWQWS